jgi:hypothetical protein
VAFAAPRTAQAQPYYCSSSTTPCFQGTNTDTGTPSGEFTSTGAAAGACNAVDISSGVGVSGGSNSGTGVLGFTDVSGDSFAPPSGEYGVYGYRGAASSGYGVVGSTTGLAPSSLTAFSAFWPLPTIGRQRSGQAEHCC